MNSGAIESSRHSDQLSMSPFSLVDASIAASGHQNLPPPASASGGCHTNPSSLPDHHPILTAGLPNSLQAVKYTSDHRSTSHSEASPPSHSISRHLSNSVSSRRATGKSHRTSIITGRVPSSEDFAKITSLPSDAQTPESAGTKRASQAEVSTGLEAPMTAFGSSFIIRNL